MAKLYKHKHHGFQIAYRVWISGVEHKKNKYTRDRNVADELLRMAEFIERGSRSCNLSPREIVQARHDGLLSDADAAALSGGKRVEKYDLDRVYEAFRLAGVVSHTHGSYQIMLRKSALVVGWLREHPIPSLTASDINKYIECRRNGSLVFRNKKNGFARRGVAPKTVLIEVQYIRQMIVEAVKMGMVNQNVADGIVVPTKASRFRASFRREELAALLESADRNSGLLHGQARELVMIALYTGMRRAELRTLEWSDIDLSTRKITLQSKTLPGEGVFSTKSGKPETVVIPDMLLPVLEGMGRRGRFVFGGDRLYNADSITNAVRIVIARAGLSGLSLHNLRHTYCSWLLRSTGGDLKYVQSAARHASVSTTANYLHNISDDDAPARSLEYK